MTSVLLVDDKPNVLSDMGRRFAQHGYRVDKATSGRAAKVKLQSTRPDVVLCDILLEDATGVEVFGFAAQLPAPPPFFLMTAYPPLKRDAIRNHPGVVVMDKPIDPADFKRREEAAREAAARVTPAFEYQPVDLQRLERRARSDEPILLTGETGVGKTLLARRIHALSRRYLGPFVARSATELQFGSAASELFGHCRGAFTGAHEDRAGAVERADGGTLFIDEVGELDPRMQGFLLSFLDAGVYRRMGEDGDRVGNVRLIAATNRDLAREVRAGHFREDLMHRLSVITEELPPLRRRPDVLPRVLEQAALRATRLHQRAELRFTPTARQRLLKYAWPGNLREVDHVMRALSASHEPCATIGESDLPDQIRDASWGGFAAPTPLVAPALPSLGPEVDNLFNATDDLPDWREFWPNDLPHFLDVIEYRGIILTLRRNDGNRAATARELSYVRSTLLHRISVLRDRYGVFRGVPVR